MTHKEKIDYLISDLAQRGIKARAAAPPLWRMAWTLGWLLPPPYFMGFFSLALLLGGLLGVMMTLFMLPAWLLIRPPMGFLSTASVNAATSLLFGIFMATYLRFSAAKLKLPPWERYPE